jgi:hypothetical protein
MADDDEFVTATQNGTLIDARGKFVGRMPGFGGPRGSKAEFAKAYLDDWYGHWKLKGPAAIQQLYEQDIVAYVKCAMFLFSKIDSQDTGKEVDFSTAKTKDDIIQLVRERSGESGVIKFQAFVKHMSNEAE